MDISHIEHIGIAVKDLDSAVAFYEEVLGFKCYAREEIEEQQVKTAFFLVGQTKIELLETTVPDGPIGKFINNRGEGIHHIAFSVNGIDKSLKEVKDKGVKLIDSEPRKGAEGMNIAFLHPKYTNGVLTELCEKSDKI